MRLIWIGLGGMAGTLARYVLGGFTTLSSFACETVQLGRDGEFLAGATVLRGIEGFGAHSRLHTAKILRLSEDLPIVVEIVDTAEKIEAFLPLVDAAVGEGLATLEKVRIRFYRAGAKPA
jgi:PII-like signaling protein